MQLYTRSAAATSGENNVGAQSCVEKIRKKKVSEVLFLNQRGKKMEAGKKVAYQVTDEDCGPNPNDPGWKRQASGGLPTNPGCPAMIRKQAGVGGRDTMSKVRLRSGRTGGVGPGAAKLPLATVSEIFFFCSPQARVFSSNAPNDRPTGLASEWAASVVVEGLY